MREYTHSHLLIGPTRARLVGAIRLAEAKANQHRPRGLVDAAAMVYFWARSNPRDRNYIEPSWQWAWGLPTPTLRSWREGIAVVGCAWWFAPDGVMHVRVVSEEIRTSSAKEMRKEAQEWGLSLAQVHAARPVCMVYPDLWQPIVFRGPQGVIERCKERLHLCPFDREAWTVLADYAEDVGDDKERERAHAALACLDRLRVCGV